MINRFFITICFLLTLGCTDEVSWCIGGEVPISQLELRHVYGSPGNIQVVVFDKESRTCGVCSCLNTRYNFIRGCHETSLQICE